MGRGTRLRTVATTPRNASNPSDIDKASVMYDFPIPGGKRYRLHCCACVAALAMLCAAPADAATPMPRDAGGLRQMSSAFEALADRVSPAVVEVLVSGYGADEEEGGAPDAPISRMSSQGSGVIVDPDGYIITNYHVINGAQQVKVVVTPPLGTHAQASAELRVHPRVLPAKIVGFSRAADLAVLKIDATGLPTVPFAKYNQLRQGTIVLAVGSPEGLKNSVTLGMVSAVLRQSDPADPMVYIQTDAAINPGNSGGALVDVDGNLVGINVSILTQSGGNEGIGFAIPAAIARYVYGQIRQYGYFRSGSIGADVQPVTPELAAALGLPSQDGVIVSNVYPSGPAAAAGLQLYDQILSIDGTPVDSMPTFVMGIYLRGQGDRVDLGIVRGGQRMSLTVPVVSGKPPPESLLDLADLDTGVLTQLGIVGLDLSANIANLVDAAPGPGVVVAATFADHRAEDIGIRYGDVIRALNAHPVSGVESLRSLLRGLAPGDPAVLQVERDGRTALLTFEAD